MFCFIYIYLINQRDNHRCHLLDIIFNMNVSDYFNMKIIVNHSVRYFLINNIKCINIMTINSSFKNLIKIIFSTWSGDRVCENFEFDETENDWIKLVPKIKLFSNSRNVRRSI